MNLSSILIVALVIVLFSLFLTIIILRNVRPSVLVSLTPSHGTLIGQPSIGNSSNVRDLFLSPPSGTLMVYVRLQINNKTQTLGQDEPLRILQLGNALQLQIRNKSGTSSTRLAVLTQNPDSEIEYIDLHNFPEQTWVHIVIVREGRRFTVYYNGKVAGSDRTKYFPTINSSQFILGDKRLNGSFALPKLVPVAYHIDEIQNELSKTSDTRHEPYMPSKSIFTGLGCPSGILCFSTSTQPISDPLKIWKTPYA
jgi:hypothetical protein